MMDSGVLKGQRMEMSMADELYPEVLRTIPRPPKRLYIVGDPGVLVSGLAVIGARKATPYGRGCAQRFARIAAEKGVVIVSGGARGCDSEAHRAALRAGGKTVVVLGGGCDEPYPPEHVPLFQQVIDSGGAVISERPWTFAPMPYCFRERNRIIAGLAGAVLIVEAGLPSGTYSTADEALEAGRDVLVVPGAITSSSSAGSNRLLLQGATPVIDDESFEDALFKSCGVLKWAPIVSAGTEENDDCEDPIVEAILAQPMTMDELYRLAGSVLQGPDIGAALMERLVEAEACGLIARQPDGKWGPQVDADATRRR